MNNSKKTARVSMISTPVLIALILTTLGGLIAGIALTILFYGSGQVNSGESAVTQKQPLYWVAPMDPNYRRDKPGKSPMGMDLIPFYKPDEKAGGEGAGTISLSPDVVNNLGVRTGFVERKPLLNQIVTVGYVKYDEDKRVHIHPRVSGWVEKLYVKAAGDAVEFNAPLYALYSPELVNAQEELLLALNRKNARLIQASENRLKALKISQVFIQTLKQTRTVQQTVTFYSPQKGVVDNLNIREGFYVEPGTTLLSIGALDEVWVEAEIFERQASLVSLGDPVTMTLDYWPGKTWQGRVDYIYPTLDSKTRTVRLRLRFDNSNKALKPNMFAQILVHTASSAPLLVIPREALIRTGRQDRVVLALGEGRFKSVEVKIGRQDHSMVEILDGLKEGEKIATSAQFLLDSESSKTSDFTRMHHGDDKPNKVWVMGQIQKLMLDHRRVTATHKAIEAWQWPAMTMDFEVNTRVDINRLTPGTRLHMEITRLDNGEYEITRTHISSAHNMPSSAEPDEAPQAVDHSAMDHSAMDHSKMGHGKMDNGNPNNGGQ